MHDYFQAIVAVLAITDPIGAVPIFISLTAGMEPGGRRAAAFRGTLTAVLILTVSALAGGIVLGLFGISLPAFKAAGGLVIVLMGLEMLNGRPTRLQRYDDAAGSDADPIVVPFAMPLVAGPGAITTVITLSVGTSKWAELPRVLVAIGVTGIMLLLFLLSAGWLASKVSARGQSIFLRFMGLILVAVGAQLLLSGIESFQLI
ncbi:MAG TPA: MarC family protein [Gemmatimonadales bacterium]|jgi:multiple antibiotic resistance protein|nr:MarC family protein [Gemmatimonadales bacterium]